MPEAANRPASVRISRYTVCAPHRAPYEFRFQASSGLPNTRPRQPVIRPLVGGGQRQHSVSRSRITHEMAYVRRQVAFLVQ